MRTVDIVEKEKMVALIRSCRTCFLGVCGSDLQPYVVPMNFGFHDGHLFLHSAQSGRKWEAMKENPKVCVTFCIGDDIAWQDEHIACSYRMKSQSVIAEGSVQFIDDFEQKVEILNHLMRQYSDREFSFNGPAVNNVGIVKLTVEHWGAKSFGEKAMTPWKR
jgi:uncharacterized protein